MYVAGEIAHMGGKALTITQDKEIVLQIRVIGTCFPARELSTSNAYLRIVGTNNVSNKVFIDYADGTGEHVYPLKASGAGRALYFTNRLNTTTPATVAGTGVYDVKPSSEPPYGLHFYQDLPVGIKNTVVNDYNQQRTITIRFEKPQNITSIDFMRVSIYGTFPSAISRLRNLNVFSVAYSKYISLFNSDFFNTQIKTLTLQAFGVSLDNGFPNWILNSPIEVLNLSSSIVLSGNPVTKKFSEINRLKNTLKALTLSNNIIDYTLPEAFGELSNMHTVNFQDCPSPLFRFCENLHGLTSLATVNVRGTSMPFSEIERLIAGLPNQSISLSIIGCGYNSDYDIAHVNTSIRSISIGYQPWNNGTCPSFVNKLLGLRDLSFIGFYTQAESIQIKNYGNFSNCINLETLQIHRLSAVTTEIPVWFSVLQKLKTINAAASFRTQVRVDAFVNNLYAFVIANAPMTGTAASKFRSMNIDLYGSTEEQTYAVRPSGTYQQPTGYIQGTSNGNPVSPMEKIYVLSIQYGHMWQYKPL